MWYKCNKSQNKMVPHAVILFLQGILFERYRDDVWKWNFRRIGFLRSTLLHQCVQHNRLAPTDMMMMMMMVIGTTIMMVISSLAHSNQTQKVIVWTSETVSWCLISFHHAHLVHNQFPDVWKTFHDVWNHHYQTGDGSDVIVWRSKTNSWCLGEFTSSRCLRHWK